MLGQSKLFNIEAQEHINIHVVSVIVIQGSRLYLFHISPDFVTPLVHVFCRHEREQFRRDAVFGLLAQVGEAFAGLSEIFRLLLYQ